MHIKKAGPKDPRQGPQILVLAPTRELAVQVRVSVCVCMLAYVR